MKTIARNSIYAAVLVAGLSLAACGNSNRASDGEAAPENIGPSADSVPPVADEVQGAPATDTVATGEDPAP